jgi:spore maturation protein CgeB
MRRLRILYASGDSPVGPALPDSLGWRRNLHDALVGLGHEVREFRYDRMPETFANVDATRPEQREFIATNRPRLSEHLLGAVEAALATGSLDVLFTYFYSSCVLPETIREVSRKGIVTINWFCNASYQFHLIEEIAPAYDFCLVPEVYRLDDYRRVGARPIYCQEAANPDFYRPVAASETYDAAFVGQSYGERPELMARLHRAGVKAHAFGPGWAVARQGSARILGRMRDLRRWSRQALGRGNGPNPFLLHPPVSDDEMVRLYARSKVSLGFGACAEAGAGGERIYQIRLRDFEAPMSGACYLAEHSEEYAAFFEPDVEVATYRSPDEMIAKSRRLLQDEGWRRRIRDNGRRRALHEHTWQKRLSGVFQQIGLA